MTNARLQQVMVVVGLLSEQYAGSSGQKAPWALHLTRSLCKPRSAAWWMVRGPVSLSSLSAATRS